ncbi:hypothetical protein ACOME3_008092 [Neoechinorhynchus agilis]
MEGWKELPNQRIIPFQEVIDEQAAMTIVDDDQQLAHLCEKVTIDTYDDEDGETMSDRKIAELLQREYDIEHDRMVMAAEQKMNGNDKIRRNLRNYLRCEQSSCVHFSDSSSDEDDESSDLAEDKEFTDLKNKLRQGQITKHDGKMCAKRNLIRAMQSGNANITTGDIGRSCSGLSDRAHNSLMQYLKNEETRQKRRQDKQMVEKIQFVVDYKTFQMLFKLIESNKISFVGSILATGKEATVVHSRTGSMFQSVMYKWKHLVDERTIEPDLSCVIKIYHTTINEFRTRSRYIRDDFRFKSRYKQLNSYKVVCLWAEKELHNLVRMHEAGLPCPRPLMLKRNALLMSFVGFDDGDDQKEKRAAPCIAHVSHEEGQEVFEEMYRQTVQIMKDLYSKCNLVHADMSEYNLLWHDGKVYVIDVGQAIENTHPESMDLLIRDCKNIVDFFGKKIRLTDMNAEGLFESICGSSFKEASILNEQRRRAEGGGGGKSEHDLLWKNVFEKKD